jgi:hypothetical protein
MAAKSLIVHLSKVRTRYRDPKESMFAVKLKFTEHIHKIRCP